MTSLVGQRESLRLEVRDEQGALTDATVVLTLTRPDGTTTQPAVDHPVAGVYTAQVTYDQAGDWLRVWQTTGVVVSVDADQVHVVAPALRIVSLAEVKEHGNITTTASDRELLDFIGTAQQMIEHLVGATVPTTVTEILTASGSRLWLTRAPVIAVASVTPYAGTTPLTPLAAGTWTLDPASGSLARPYGGWAARVEVVYRAGRAPIPEAIRWAAKELAIHLWRSTQTLRGGRGRGAVDDQAAAVGAGYGLPHRVEDALGPFLRAPAVA
ncbi:hypothetical protein [Micromonospora aurantiaca (nom. illeg.)]|uniref:hypothetical protein n=1 Tax=Micromonospora aurantiaca (nom. illeg.) TaxID=47850 RepID=UPI0033F280E0